MSLKPDTQTPTISPDAALEQYYQGELTLDEIIEVFRSQPSPPLESDTPDLLGAIRDEIQTLADRILVTAGLGGPTLDEALEAYNAYELEADQVLTAARRQWYRR